MGWQEYYTKQHRDSLTARIDTRGGLEYNELT
jgi:hypothetical protein